jgi:hypothetical protein
MNMTRRFNYTDRQKIRLSDVSIRLYRQDSDLLFAADLRALTGYELDPAARVHVEAYRTVSTLWRRFDFGRVGLLRAPEDVKLTDFGKPEGILFRVKVAKEGELQGRLLAEADQIRPRLPDEAEHSATPLIDSVPGPIGDEPWRVDFLGGAPQLVINEQIEDWKGFARDPHFRALVAPAVMRQILAQILINDRDKGDLEDPTDWRGRWIRFAELLPGVSGSPDALGNAEDVDSRPDVTEWINTAVEAFCRRAGLLASMKQLLGAENAR